jgi:hypothetical protein
MEASSSMPILLGYNLGGATGIPCETFDGDPGALQQIFDKVIPEEMESPYLRDADIILGVMSRLVDEAQRKASEAEVKR